MAGGPPWQDRLRTVGVDEDVPILTATFPAQNPFDVFRCYIASKLSDLTGKNASEILSGVAWTSSPDKGDLTFPVPRLNMKDRKPADLCSNLATEFPVNQFVQQPTTFGVSLRFDYHDNILPVLVLPEVYRLGAGYGLNKLLGASDKQSAPGASRKRVVIEFSSPNIAKEFHVGHLRSTIIGAFLSNLYEGLGWDVIRLNYLGDWGRQFGLLAAGWDKYGDEQLFQQDPIRHLFHVYTTINKDFKPEQDAYDAAKDAGQNTEHLEQQGLLGISKGYVKRMEAGDESALGLWRRFREISIEKYARSYARLNVHFDRYSGESEVKAETMEEAEQILRSNGISETDDGASMIDFKKHGRKKLGTCVIRNRNGTTSYLLRDVGAAIQRMREYKMDHMIYVVMAQQNVHLEQLFAIFDLMGGEFSDLSRRMQHITFGKVRGMSTRSGNVQLLEDVLDDIRDSMHQVMRQNQEKYAQVPNPDETADTLGMTSLIVQDMSGKRINDYSFSLERMLSFEGDTGPYLQYAHARLCSMIRRAGFSNEELASANPSVLVEPHALRMIRIIGAWPDTVIHTHKTLEPATVVTYLFRLTHQVSSSYDVLKVVNAECDGATSLARAMLFNAARQVLSNGMRVLGLTPVERM